MQREGVSSSCPLTGLVHDALSPLAVGSANGSDDQAIYEEARAKEG